MIGKSNSETNGPSAQKWHLTLFYVICALVIGILIWGAAPGCALYDSAHAKDGYYNLLVQGFQSGQLNVKKDAPPGLTLLPDPYDPKANAAYLSGVEDLSYYHGKLYLYFGVTPALVLFWPYSILTGHYLLDAYAGLIFCSVGFLIGAGLLYAIWRRYFSEVHIWVVMTGVCTFGFVIGAHEMEWLYCRVYEVALSCAFASSMLALAALWAALHDRQRCVSWLVLASVAYGLAIGSRPSLLFGGVILLAPVIREWCSPVKPRSYRQIALLLAASVGPVMVIVLGLMLYNFERFGNPIEFGYRYQLSILHQMSTHQFGFGNFWLNFQYYFLEPFHWNAHFPFLQSLQFWPSLFGRFGPEQRYYGGIILAGFPLLWLALCAPLAWRNRPPEEASVLRGFAAALSLFFFICALTLCFFVYARNRYELDFLPAGVLLAMTGILGVERLPLSELCGGRFVRWGWRILLVWTVLLNALAAFESCAEANYLVGNSFMNQGLEDKAIQRFQIALVYSPEFAEAYDGLGSALLQKKQISEAVSQFEKALEIKPNFPKAHNNLGFGLFQMGRLDDAIAEFQKAVELEPQSAIFQNALGNALAKKGDMNGAIFQFQKTLELDPGLAETHYNLAYCYFQAGRVDDAMVEYQKAIELQSGYADAYNGLGNAFAKKGQWNQAIAQYQKTLELNPNFAEARFNLGYCFLQSGRLDDAIAQFQATLTLQPQLAPAYYSLGEAYRKKGMMGEAKEAYKKAVELDPHLKIPTGF